MFLTMLPAWLRQKVYYRRYYRRQQQWSDLFTRASLSVFPAITMHNLIPGDEISASIAFLGFYEWNLTKKIAHHAAGGGLFVDVGANMGYFALLWAGASRTGRVIAFEASPRNISLLANNVRQNHCEDRVTVIAKAAGDHDGSVSFDTGPAEQSGWGGLAEGDPKHMIVVPMVRLDEQLPDTEIDVLKIDTEGADTLVLFGCERLLKAKKIKAIYFEVNADKIQRLGLRPVEAQRFLQSLGYECRSFDGGDTEWFAHPA